MVRELTVGRRIGFYKIRGEIGCGNFSHVKLGIHALTKGKKLQDIETQRLQSKKGKTSVEEWQLYRLLTYIILKY